MCKNPFLFLKIVEASFCGPRNCLYSIWIFSANDDTSTFLDECSPAIWDNETNRELKQIQLAKKVVSDSPGLVDFAIGLVNSAFNLPDGQVMFFLEF